MEVSSKKASNQNQTTEVDEMCNKPSEITEEQRNALFQIIGGKSTLGEIDDLSQVSEALGLDLENPSEWENQQITKEMIAKILGIKLAGIELWDFLSNQGIYYCTLQKCKKWFDGRVITEYGLPLYQGHFCSYACAEFYKSKHQWAMKVERARNILDSMDLYSIIHNALLGTDLSLSSAVSMISERPVSKGYELKKYFASEEYQHQVHNLMYILWDIARCSVCGIWSSDFDSVQDDIYICRKCNEKNDESEIG